MSASLIFYDISCKYFAGCRYFIIIIRFFIYKTLGPTCMWSGKQEQSIIDIEGGYQILDEQDGFKLNWESNLISRVEAKGTDYWKDRALVVQFAGALCDTQPVDKIKLRTQILLFDAGDGFRMFNYCGGKFVNLVNKLVGVDKLQGTACACKTISCWEGSDGYWDVKAKIADVQDFISRFNKDGGLHLPSGVLIKGAVIGGGDMAWISDTTGHRGFAGQNKCCFCTCNKSQLHDALPPDDVHQRTYLFSCHSSHCPTSEEDFPFTCPCCAKEFTCKDMFDQLATLDLVGRHIKEQGKTRPTLCKRKAIQVGRMPLQVAFKCDLDLDAVHSAVGS